jgi:hypothetical protein
MKQSTKENGGPSGAPRKSPSGTCTDSSWAGCTEFASVYGTKAGDPEGQRRAPWDVPHICILSLFSRL